MEKCPICLSSTDFKPTQISHNVHKVECKKCGEFKIDEFLILTPAEAPASAEILADEAVGSSSPAE